MSQARTGALFGVEQAQPGASGYVDLSDPVGQRLLLGAQEILHKIEKAVAPFHLEASPDERGVALGGDEVAVLLASRVFEHIRETPIRQAEGPKPTLTQLVTEAVDLALWRDLSFRLGGLLHAVKPKSVRQVAYMRDLLDNAHPLVFGVGPTGTGKTHLAIAAAIDLLREEKFKHVVVTRPHTPIQGEVMTAEARAEKTRDGQLAVIYDVLHDLLRHSEVEKLIDDRRLEILPLGLLRGRSFNHAYIVIDEAQNMTPQMTRMAVTRLGRHSRMAVTGDPSQTDLREDQVSGLAHLLQMIRGTGIGRVHYFERPEIIRNSVVARLEELYAQNEPVA